MAMLDSEYFAVDATLLRGAIDVLSTR